MEKQKLLNQQELADYLGTTVGTLNTWRCQNRYPIPYIKVGALIRYDLEQVNKWLEIRTKNKI